MRAWMYVCLCDAYVILIRRKYLVSDLSLLKKKVKIELVKEDIIGCMKME